jgi:4-alpha-methyl-delta7-sterol-4alpha-methyl oxidase
LIIVPLLVSAYPFFTFLKFDAAIPLPSWGIFTAQFVFFMFAEDFTHYFLHRLLHTPWLYKNIHKVHHTYQAPFGLSASFSHPLEILILGFCTFSGPLLLRPHYFTFFCWIVYRQMDAVLTHSGYDLPYDPLNIIPFYGGAKAHDYHHKVFNCNYSSRFTYLDKLFDTYKEPPEIHFKKA